MGMYEAILNFKERLTSQPWQCIGFLNFKEESHHEILRDILNFEGRLTSQTSGAYECLKSKMSRTISWYLSSLKFKAPANTHVRTHHNTNVHMQQWAFEVFLN